MSSVQKPNILVCAYSCLSESGVKQIGGEAELGSHFVKQLGRFFTVYVLTHSFNQKAIEDQGNFPENIHFFYIRLPQWLSFLETMHKGGIQIYAYLWQIKAYFVARKLNKQYQFKAFHHITYANDWMASYIGALLQVPYIRGPGGGAHHIPKAFQNNYSFLEKWLEQIRSIGQWVFRHDPFFIIGRNRAKAILVCNQEAFAILPKKLKKRVYLFPVNGVSKEDLAISSSRKNKFFKVISAGKFIKLKNINLAIASFALFHKNNPDSKLVLVGDGPEYNNLQKLVEEYQLQGSVEFKKWMPRIELLKEIAGSDVFLFPSLRDGGGAVVVEAMAAGKPVICFDTAGPGFHVDQNIGIKIKPENPEQAVRDIAVALEKLYQNELLRKTMGKMAKEKAEREYVWDKLGDRLRAIYQEVLQ